MNKLSHINESGKANMVDVSHKNSSTRTAKATGKILLNADTLELIKNNSMKKGDVLTVAEVAGIQAAKETSKLIPLCHTLLLTKVDISCTIENNGIRVNSFVKTNSNTGVEMEALTGVSVALLTLYDMCKAADKNMIISDISLIEKTK